MTNAAAAQPTVSDAQKACYRRDGYMILDNMIDAGTLAMLREECAYFMGYKDAELDLGGRDSDMITQRGKRYFIYNWYRKSQRLWRFIFSPLMAEVARAALGDDVYLFHEQWVVKGAEQGMSFDWHQDSAYVQSFDPATQHRPFLTCWCPLDDVGVDNGTVYLLPHSRGGTQAGIVPHRKDPATQDLIADNHGDPGMPICVKAGAIVAFSSHVLHSSGANRTDTLRRVYLPQYSAEPIIDSKTGKPLKLAVPFVKGGRIVYDPETDLAAA
ncbi:MAG: phytanoyl-CoA dioxygenase family protein [Alphaproteobacteria bacterium]|nr:MAG: phytanoyl-CoA dioxygenase family protein [Alphaproteobacteria bacterium]